MSAEAVSDPISSNVPSRRRGPALEQAIFAAAVEELRTVGYGGLTMEGVAARAHTGKAALYRRWSSKRDLIVDAIHHLLPSVDAVPDHGTLRADMMDLLGQMQQVINSPDGCPLEALMGDPSQDEAFGEAMRQRVFEPRGRILLAVLRRAAERGQARPEAVTPLVAEVGPSLMMKHYLATREPLPDSFVTDVVDQVIMPLVAPTD